MQPINISIIHKKDDRMNSDLALEIQRFVFIAARSLNQPVNIEVTSSHENAGISELSQEDMPILIIDNNVVFTKQIPPVDFIKQCIAPPLSFREKMTVSF